jgi:hypothetical protein
MLGPLTFQRACCLGLAVAICSLFIAPAASAEQPTEPVARKSWDAPLLVARGHIGIGTPLGFIGASAELNVMKYFAVQLGAGQNGEGLQLAFMGHGRLPVSSDVALTLGAGVSEGAYAYRSNVLDADHSNDTRWDAAVFLNGELGLEILSPGGFSLRMSVGVARLLNPGSVSRCTSGADPVPCAPTREKAHTFPYIGIAMGYAFSL